MFKWLKRRKPPAEPLPPDPPAEPTLDAQEAAAQAALQAALEAQQRQRVDTLRARVEEEKLRAELGDIKRQGRQERIARLRTEIETIRGRR